MNNVSHNSLKVLLVVLMALYPHLGSAGRAEAAGAAGGTGGIFSMSGQFGGEVLDSSGSPAADVPMRVLDSEGNELLSTLSDAEGKFELNGLEPGEYRLALGDDLELNLTVSEAATQSNFRIILPEEGMRPGAGLIGGAGEEGTNWSFIALTGLVLAITVPTGFAIAAAVGNDDDGHN